MSELIYFGGSTGFVAGCQESQDWVDETVIDGVTPDVARLTLYDTFFCNIVASGVYADADYVRVYALPSGNEDLGKISLVNPSRARAIYVNSPVFTPDVGVSTNPSRTAYIDTQWSQNEAGNNYQANDAYYGAYLKAYTNQNGQDVMGSRLASGNGSRLTPGINDGRTGGQINSTNSRSTNVSFVAPMDVAFRKLSGTERIYINGVDTAGHSVAGAVAVGGTVTELGSRFGASISNIMRADAVLMATYQLKTMSAAKHLSLHTELNTLLTGIGALP
jgi:hypothetical protein